LPSFTHFIFGVGFPVALQWNVAVADSSTVWLAGVVIKLGATETKNIRFQVETNYYLWNELFNYIYKL